MPAQIPTWSQIQALAAQLGELAVRQQLTLTTAESCTGGLLAAAITDIAGSSGWFEQGIISYANAVKTRLLGVETTALAEHGAVSEVVVRQMALGARQLAGADWAMATSGIAGPGGGSVAKPVGTVWFAWAGPDGAVCQCCHFAGDRQAIRWQAVHYALQQLQEKISA